MKQVALSRQPKNANPLLIDLSGLHRIPANELKSSNMSDDDDGLEAELWDLIDEFCTVTPPVKAIALDSLFESQMSVRLATAFLAFQKQQQSSSILSPDQLTAM